MSGAIVAMGGAEFAMRPENEALHDYVLGVARVPEPRVCLLPTASGDPHAQISSFHAAMDRRDCEASSISLFRLGEVNIDLEQHLLAQDVIYVTGGNMVNLMALWREHELDRILPEAYARGALLCGYSAGSMCWFEEGVSTGVGKPVPTAGLGMLSGSHCVHYSQDPPRRRVYRELVGSGEISGGLALDDYAAALFRGRELIEAVRSKQGAGATMIERDPSGGLLETPLPTRMLEPTIEERETALEEMRAVRRMRDHGVHGRGDRSR